MAAITDEENYLYRFFLWKFEGIEQFQGYKILTIELLFKFLSGSWLDTSNLSKKKTIN